MPRPESSAWSCGWMVTRRLKRWMTSSKLRSWSLPARTRSPWWRFRNSAPRQTNLSSSTLNNSSTWKKGRDHPVPFSLLAYTIGDADSGRGHHRRRHRRREHCLPLDRCRSEERPHHRARESSGQGFDGEEHGWGPRAILDAREHPDVAVLDPVLCDLRGAVRTSLGI